MKVQNFIKVSTLRRLTNGGIGQKHFHKLFNVKKEIVITMTQIT